RQQPSLRLSRAQLEAALGRADLARVGRNPTIVLEGSVGTSSGQKVPVGMGMGSGSGSGDGTGSGNNGERLGPDFFSHQESTGLSATASWRIYDFGQTAA